MSKIQFLKFDPLSVFKYHASFWIHSTTREKMHAVAIIIVPLSSVPITKWFLNNERNMILSSRYSRFADYAILGTILYVFSTALIGFMLRTHKKIEKAEQITKLLQESQSKTKILI
jgi:hypothetical protein